MHLLDSRCRVGKWLDAEHRVDGRNVSRDTGASPSARFDPAAIAVACQGRGHRYIGERLARTDDTRIFGTRKGKVYWILGRSNRA